MRHVSAFLLSFFITMNIMGCGQQLLVDKEGGRMDACYYRTEGSDRCGTSFLRLMSNPKSAAGKSIIIVGYLAPRSGVALLYPTEQDYLNDDIFNSISIEGDDVSILNDKWYRVVRVRADFSLRDSSGAPWFGVLNNPEVVDVVVPAEHEDSIVIHQKIKK